MLLHFLALGVAFRVPAARPHVTAPRTAVMTMMAGSDGTGSYLDKTISSQEDDDATRDSAAPVVGRVAPTQRPPAGTEGVVNNYYIYDSDTWEQSGGAPAPKPPDFNAIAAAPETSTLSTRAVRLLGPLALAGGAVAGTLALTSVTSPKPITQAEVLAAQKEWGDAIVRISKTYLDGGDYVGAAGKAADQLYGYGRSDVLFKPTKAAEAPFRPTAEGALSYFIGGDKVAGGFSEDKGFALGPGGVGWKKVIFDNNKVTFNGATAQAMGEYYFYSAADDSVAKVEYTFGYKRNEDGKMRIYLHHSSLPYPGKKKPPAEAPKA